MSNDANIQVRPLFATTHTKKLSHVCFTREVKFAKCSFIFMIFYMKFQDEIGKMNEKLANFTSLVEHK